MGRAAVLPHNYPHLQNLIKRDAASYEQEFLQQYQHFKASLAIVESGASAADDHFEALVAFTSHVSNHYSESREEFPKLIMGFLEREAASMHPSLRKTLVQCTLLLRKHNQVQLIGLLELFFRLFRIQDKSLREMLYISIVGEVRRANRPHKNNALNRSLQNFMYGLFEESATAKVGTEENLALDRILQIIIELYRKRVWDDSQTVNVIAEAAVKKISPKVMNTSLNFFIGRFRGKALQADGTSDEEEEEDGKEYVDLLHKSSFSGANKRSTKKKLKKALNEMHRKERKTQDSDQHGSFAAIHLLHDPQGFVEKLFSHLKRSNDTFELKLLMMNVISRVIGAHKLVLLDFYSFLLRYIQPHQKEVTHILAYAAQATHEMVPEEVIEPMVMAIAHNFAAEHCANEVIAAGLNGLREICSRCPSSMSSDLLQDLANFKGYNNKGVVMAARSLITLYREVNPTMLHRRDRGKEVSVALKEGKIMQRKGFNTAITHFDASNLCTSENTGENTDDNTDENFDNEELELVSNSEAELEGDDNSEDDSNYESSQQADIVQLAAQKILEPEEISRFKKRLAGQVSDLESDQSSNDDEDPEVVDPKSLESKKKTKADYEARMMSIKAGREGRLKFGSRKGKHHEKSSTSNRVKEKTTKNAIMLAHKGSVRAKKRRSLRERQLTQNRHRKKQKLRK